VAVAAESVDVVLVAVDKGEEGLMDRAGTKCSVEGSRHSYCRWLL
jgi:hypothetical protein